MNISTGGIYNDRFLVKNIKDGGELMPELLSVKIDRIAFRATLSMCFNKFPVHSCVAVTIVKDVAYSVI